MIYYGRTLLYIPLFIALVQAASINIAVGKNETTG